MGEDLAKYLVDADEPSSTKKVVVRRTKPKPKTKTHGVSGWDGGYSKPKTYTRPKGDTGTGRKSTQARPRCQMDDCQAFQSPARSGYCSWHESQHLAPGEQPKILHKRGCMTCGNLCEPPLPGEDEPQFCKTCIYLRANPDKSELDYDELEL
jgi:hypothetical protein